MGVSCVIVVLVPLLLLLLLSFFFLYGAMFERRKACYLVTGGDGSGEVAGKRV